MKITIHFKRLDERAKAPKQGHPGDAGFDLYATSCERIGLFKYRYGTGIAVGIPRGYEGQIRPRSSIHKSGMILANSIVAFHRDQHTECTPYVMGAGLGWLQHHEDH